MKVLKVFALVLFVSCASYAQSTKTPCISRCEEVFGAGNSKCSHMCQNYREDASTPPRKKSDKNEAPVSASASASASASDSGIANPNIKSISAPSQKSQSNEKE